jgi:5-methyltetrahydropteroyltriglutamate--homocysteine methyltransferase
MKTLLPTSTAGSLPKPTWLAQPETLWSPWKLQDQELLAKQDALRLSLDEQIRAGIDIVSDGEQTRQHFVTTFIEHLSGVDFENRQTVRIRNRYDASVPTVVSRLRARNRSSSTMQSTCASSRTSRSNPAGADDHDRHPV